MVAGRLASPEWSLRRTQNYRCRTGHRGTSHRSAACLLRDCASPQAGKHLRQPPPAAGVVRSRCGPPARPQSSRWIELHPSRRGDGRARARRHRPDARCAHALLLFGRCRLSGYRGALQRRCTRQASPSAWAAPRPRCGHPGTRCSPTATQRVQGGQSRRLHSTPDPLGGHDRRSQRGSGTLYGDRSDRFWQDAGYAQVRAGARCPPRPAADHHRGALPDRHRADRSRLSGYLHRGCGQRVA